MYWSHSLYEAIALRASGVLFVALKGNLLQLSIWNEDFLEIVLGDAEVDVADVETVERSTISSASSTTFSGSSTRGAVFLCFGKLRNDRNALELLSCQLQGLRDRGLVAELDIANTK